MNIRLRLRFLSELETHFSIVDNLVLDSLSCHLLLKPYKFSFYFCGAMVTQFRF